MPLEFMDIPEHCAEMLLPALQLGSGDNEEIELAALGIWMDLVKVDPVRFDAAAERRLDYYVSVLRTQHGWLKRERLSCIEWNHGKAWPKEGSALVDNPDGLTLLTTEAVTRCVEDNLWDEYKKAEAALYSATIGRLAA